MSESDSIKIKRREFIIGSAAVCLGFCMPGRSPFAAGSENSEIISAAHWVRVAPDNTVTIMSPAAEMGQGSMTAIPMIFAEEFDVAWEQVKIEFSPSDDTHFKNPTSWVRSIMLTLGSSAVSGYYDTARLYGAQARQMFLSAAAERWGVPVNSLRTEKGVISMSPGVKKITYGELAADIDPASVSGKIATPALKAPSEFNIIGKSVERCDVPDKVKGIPLFSIDIDLPGMLFATVVHSPVNGAPVEKIINKKQIESRKKVLRVVSLKDAVAVVAESYEVALKAEKDLEIQWGRVDKLDNYSDESGFNTHLQMLRNSELSGIVVQQAGDVGKVKNKVEKEFSAEYFSDYIYHAQMEPLNAVADVKSGGVDLWVGTQAPTHCIRSVAKELNLPEAKINLKRMFLGGGFGRRGAQDHDYVIDAVRLSGIMKKPVKVIWSREADVKSGRFKPIKAVAMKAGLDARDKLLSWEHRTVSDEALKQSDPYRYEKAQGWPVISSSGMESDYDIENIHAEIVDPDTGVRTSPHRGIGATVNKFASESFLDEIALRKNIDPLDIRLGLLHRHDRAIQVLHTVSDMAEWEQRKRNTGFGMAFDSVYFPSAYVVKVGVNKSTGVIRVEKVWAAVDVGLALHPDNIQAQLEGQIIFAISSMLKERITMSNGAVDQSNFHDYPVLRMNEVPDMEITVISNPDAKPAGVGDSRLSAIPAAIANAYTDASGIRLRHMPFTPERVKISLSV